MSVAVTITGLDKLQARLARLGSLDRAALLDQVGAIVESQTKRRIQNEKTAPSGAPWEPWSQRYERTRHSGQSLLQNEGDLLDSIQFIVSGDEVEVGTNLVYGATHQFGDPARNIPERPFLGLSPANETELLEVLEDYLDRVTT